MSIEYYIKGAIKSNKTVGKKLETNGALMRVIESIPEDTEVEITIKGYKKNRSNAQNRWYWGMAIPAIARQIKELTGESYTKEELHKYNLQEVCKVPHTIREILGKTVIIFQDKSTKSMSTQEFNDFKSLLQGYYAERDIIIPDPMQENFLNEIV